MKIGISLLMARIPHTGVENVALNLVAHLQRLHTNDDFVIYADSRRLPHLFSASENVQVIDVRLPSGRLLWLWEHIFFLTDRRAKTVDIVHFPIGAGVLGYRRPFVLTMHDLKHYLNRDLVLLRRHLMWRVWCKSNMSRASAVITVSDFVKNEILREFPLRPSDVRVIPNGVDQRFTVQDKSVNFRAKYHLPERYVLFVGQTSTNKNLGRAIDAFLRVRRNERIDHHFVIAGMPGEADGALKAYVKDARIEDIVKFIGYVDNDDLPNLYSNADLFLFPSLTEGFGIPPLEAMRCAIPVVAARAASLPEVLADAAIWVDPFSIDSIAEGICTGLTDQNVRTRVIARGLDRAAIFNWEKMASETLNVYREAVPHDTADCPIVAEDPFEMHSPASAAINNRIDC
jgi:glycosyltransferase involved in cell wall biosynthesis